MRSAHCMVKLHNTTQYVRDNLCEDAGLTTPSKIQKCGQDCPMWSHGDWSACEDSRCFTWNTAMQKRDVTCAFSNGTEVDASFCDQNEKPTMRQECYNDRCKGTWKVGEWSEVIRWTIDSKTLFFLFFIKFFFSARLNVSKKV